MQGTMLILLLLIASPTHHQGEPIMANNCRESRPCQNTFVYRIWFVMNSKVNFRDQDIQRDPLLLMLILPLTYPEFRVLECLEIPE